MFPHWVEMLLPAVDGTYHHGTSGAIAPDTVVLVLDDRVLALADAIQIGLVNLYAHDSEYFLVVRLREIVDEGLWLSLPWAPFRAPTVLYAVDKFHGTEWVRVPEDARTLSYGGGWDDLQWMVDEEAPPSCADSPWVDRTIAPSDGALLRATSRGDARRVAEMLARGGSIHAGGVAPDVRNGLTMGFSWANHDDLLHTAAQQGHVEVLEVLLAAGAHVDQRDPDGWTALYTAIANKRAAAVELLLRRGADPRLLSRGEDARAIARRYAPELLTLLPDD